MATKLCTNYWHAPHEMYFPSTLLSSLPAFLLSKKYKVGLC